MFRIVLSLLTIFLLVLFSCGKKQTLFNDAIAENSKKNEIVESEDVVKLKLELAESQEALEKAIKF